MADTTPEPEREGVSLLGRVTTRMSALTGGRSLASLFRPARDEPVASSSRYEAVDDAAAGVDVEAGRTEEQQHDAGDASSSGSGAPPAPPQLAQQQLASTSRRGSSADLATAASTKLDKAASLGLLMGGEQGAPVCLICLDPLSPEDFDSGEALQLQCNCRGELAMRHKLCAARWAGVKGDNVCDICKAPIRNLPAPILPSDSEDDEEVGVRGSEAGDIVYALPREDYAGGDSVFDCVRVVWVTSIIGILFFQLDLSDALWVGVIVGLGYSLFARIVARSRRAALAAAYGLPTGPVVGPQFGVAGAGGRHPFATTHVVFAPPVAGGGGAPAVQPAAPPVPQLV